ncbi:ricin-type beta-trefoil lectin domain protein [Streptomyces sp. NPDC058548]|uniref:ricin-type beta-trefoil lectin domain protein n=1 Tax=unclassified Streptomyces TaxID=2593676 RepID=UPI003649A76D
MVERPERARHGRPGLGGTARRRRVLVGGTAVAVVAASAFALSARATETAPPPAPAAPPAAATPATVGVQAWLWPGPKGSTTCSAPAEYADGRLKHGVLKPEYFTIDTTGRPVLLDASDPDYACNGYSPANAAHVKAHSSRQFVTVSLAQLVSERRLTGDPAKRAAAVKRLADFTEQVDFNGVDVDFENYWAWSAQDAANFYTFIGDLAKGLHARGLKLQVEGPPDITTRFDYGKALAVGADEVVMMAYDLQYQSPVGDTCLPFAPYDWTTHLLKGALAQIPADRRHRFVAGLPSEAYTASDRCQTIKGNQTIADMREAPGFSTDPKVVESRRDPNSGEVRWRAGGKFYDYVDQRGLDAKLKLARDLGAVNVSVWALGGDNAWFSPGALAGKGALVSKASQRCLNAPSAGDRTRMEVRDCDRTSGQVFRPAADGSLRVLGKCVDAAGRKTTPGTPVILFACNGGTNQQWRLHPDGKVGGVQSGLCLDVVGGEVAAPNGTRLELQKCTGTADQIWTAA